jgi:hypothetical protein
MGSSDRPETSFPPSTKSASPPYQHTHTMAYCDRCERWFPHDRAYEQHVENSSSHWMCDDCDVDFASEESLNQHYTNSPRHNYCQECDKHFHGDDAREQHMRAVHWYCDRHNRVRYRRSDNMPRSLLMSSIIGNFRCFDRRETSSHTTGTAVIIKDQEWFS